MSQHYNIALGVYRDFLNRIVKQHVFSDVERSLASGVLADEAKKGIAADKREDIRPPYLCTVSGKGGWSADPAITKKYSAFTNVSLLDHLNSVVRGSLMFGALDLLAGGIAPDDVRRRLYLVAAIAFSHDLDKVIGKSRSEDLSVAEVDEFMNRFGIGDFLMAGGIQCEPDLFLALISQVEDSRAGILPKGAVITPDWRNGRKDTVYVGVADKMDSMFLNTEKSIDDVLEVLATTEDLKSDALRAGWRTISWDDPNIAFLLDHLQLEISNACQRYWGAPPLIEMHHDGRLLCVVPECLGDKIVETAVGKLASVLGGEMRVDVNARGSIDILDARGDIGSLRSIIQIMPDATRTKILQVKIGWAKEHRAEIVEMLHPTGYGPRFPDLGSFSKKLVPLWAGDLREDGIREFHEEACLATVLLCCVDASPKLGIPDGDVRERELLDLLSAHDKLALVPEWLSASDAKDRRPLLAALAVAHAMSDESMRDALIGEGGLLETWLTGSADRKGLVEKIESTSDKLNSAIRDHIGHLMRREVIMAEDEDAEGRCHFTNMPISKDAKIDLKSGLYAVNVSAFSGRSGRPEFFNRAEAETLVSPISLAEHKLRQIKFAANSGMCSVAMNISSPATAGLFGALAMDREPINMTLTDMMRADKSKPSLMSFSNSNGLSKRILISRFEAFPTSMVGDSKKKTMGQLGFVRGILQTALRLGRPVHVFRGLPRPTRDFVWFDTLPEAIELAVGGRGLRLEQLPPVIRLLRGIEAISEQTGFGLDIALSVADPATRFGAACMAYSKAASVSEPDFKVSAIKRFASNILEETGPMSEQDKSISSFAEAMAKYQKAPRRDDGANVYERGFRIALEQAEVLSANGMASDEHLKAGIAGSIKAEYDRADIIIARDSVLEEAVRVFVEDVWTKAFKRQAPDSRIRRSAFAIYRWTFTQAVFAKFNQPASN